MVTTPVETRQPGAGDLAGGALGGGVGFKAIIAGGLRQDAVGQLIHPGTFGFTTTITRTTMVKISGISLAQR